MLHFDHVLVFLLVCLLVFLAWGASAAEDRYTARPGSMEVATVKLEWHDAARNRDVPVKIFYPKSAESACPVIVFSHGLGGSRDGYGYLGQHWASHGYVSVHLQHIGSDTAVWLGSRNIMGDMGKAAANPANSINRPLDVRFAIDQIAKLNKDEGPLKGKLDLDRIGMAGHSFGAYTTLAAVGEVFVLPGGIEKSLSEPRIKAAVAMSSPVPAARDHDDKAFGSIKVPVFHMTGTKDDSPIGNSKAADRRIPFDHSKPADTYLLILKDGDHMVFSGRVGVQRPLDKEQQALILSSSLAFWDAYLKDDAAAKKWLAEGAFERSLGAGGTFEKKGK